MKRFSLIFLLLLGGCSTLPLQKSNYNEITVQELIAMVGHQPPANTPAITFYYAGSDDNYDYMYSNRAVLFAGLTYHGYKMKKGILNLPKRFDFDPCLVSAGPTAGRNLNYSLINNAASDEYIKSEFRKLLSEKAGTP